MYYFRNWTITKLGQVMIKHVHSTNSGNTFLQDIAYTYNERGWLLGSSAPLFQMQLQYNTSSITGVTPTAQFNGNIASQSWGTSSTPNANTTVYLYDSLNRLLSGNNSVTGNSENTIAYDLNGNVESLNRYQANAPIDILTYRYTGSGLNAAYGNQLQNVTDNSGSNTGLPNGMTTYMYDSNGNMLSANSTTTGIQYKSFIYNQLNLPITAAVTNGIITYTYDAEGNKLRKVSVLNGVPNATDYINGIEYDNSTTTIGFIQTEEGKATPASSGYDYYYYLSDNLGNTRVTFDTQTASAVMQQQDDYYPFGMDIPGTKVASPKNEYLYNKKELQEEFTEYDYGARFYDPIIARFTTEDTYAEKYSSMTPYQYGALNPIKNIDINGDSIKVNINLSIPILGVGNINVNTSVHYQGGTAYYQNGTVYNGNDQFVAQVGSALNSLGNGTEGSELVNELERSTNNTTIINDINDRGNLTANDGSQIRWNPIGTTGGPDQTGSLTRMSFIGLGHEFSHVEDIINGTIDNSIWYYVRNADGEVVGSVSNAEKYATYRENQIRAENSMSLREFYSPTATGEGYEPSRILKLETNTNLWFNQDPSKLNVTGHNIIATPSLPTTLKP